MKGKGGDLRNDTSYVLSLYVYKTTPKIMQYYKTKLINALQHLETKLM